MVSAFEKHLEGWKGKNVSIGGKIVIIKSVLRSLPLYFRSFYLAPKIVLDTLVGNQRRFLWGGANAGNRSAG